LIGSNLEAVGRLPSSLRRAIRKRLSGNEAEPSVAGRCELSSSTFEAAREEVMARMIRFGRRERTGPADKV
jgi:hypothetical protein